MSRLKVAFADVYMGFHETDYLFKHLFMKRYNAIETTQNPDIVFFNHRKRKWKQYAKSNAIKVFITGEVQHKDHHPNDFSFSFDPTDDTNFYLPGFVRDEMWFNFLDGKKLNETPKTKFCHFIYKNDKAKERIRFCQALMKYKHVDCPGEVLNNMPNFTQEGRKANRWRRDKVMFTKPYKFAIAYENVAAERWITEKIFHPYLTGSVPIYWGAPDIDKIINPDSFIHARDFANDKELVEYVKKVDNNEELYQQYLNAPMLRNDSELAVCNKENLFQRFDEIVKVAKSR